MIGSNEKMEFASVKSRFVAYIVDKFVVVGIAYALIFTFAFVFGSDMKGGVCPIYRSCQCFHHHL